MSNLPVNAGKYPISKLIEELTNLPPETTFNYSEADFNSLHGGQDSSKGLGTSYRLAVDIIEGLVSATPCQDAAIDDKIREFAYLLSEAEDHPFGQDQRFWDEAKIRLTPATWDIRSGRLIVSGYGTFEDVLKLSLKKAVDEGCELSSQTWIGNSSFSKMLDTKAWLERFEFWS